MISEELEAKIDSVLGYPTHDPHGDPIPDADLKWPADEPGGNAEAPPTRRAVAR